MYIFFLSINMDIFLDNINDAMSKKIIKDKELEKKLKSFHYNLLIPLVISLNIDTNIINLGSMLNDNTFSLSIEEYNELFSTIMERITKLEIN